jgi:hypothetical protein
MRNPIRLLIIVIAIAAAGWMLYQANALPEFGREPLAAECYVGGCSGQICSDQEGIASTCEWTEAYACYQNAKCERQASGECGWTETSELQMCLSQAQQ